MSDLIVACLRIGRRYDLGYVTGLRDRVALHLPRQHTMMCLTDQPDRCSGVGFVDITAIELHGEWCKMVLFEPMWRGRSKVIFLDIHTDIWGDISPLADVPGEFAIGVNLETREFDTRVMVIGGGMGNFVWSAFERHRKLLMYNHAGPSGCIKELYPSAPLLPRLLPQHFFRTRMRLMQPL
jgi:hypothetical protein